MILQRVLAGIAAAVLAGLLLGVLEIATASPRPPISAVPGLLLAFVTLAVVLGTVPLVGVVLLSRARLAPWLAVPVIAVGAAAGVYFGVNAVAKAGIPNPPVLTDWFPFVVAVGSGTVGASLASFLLKRGPAPVE